ncbi:MAG TPA: hypothetical protein VFQ77_01055 [Pseudonocardiaceae bacterium]|jgi:hypothetical protein|nr:hypothetical protein [Pseudonocardiaceae bacterium]
MVDGHAFELGELVRTAKDKQIGVRWPIPVDARLDALMERAVEAGERTTRREVVAALVATTDLDGEAIGRLLRKYRTMRVREVLLDTPADARVVRIAGQRPGPRSWGRST